MNLPQMANFSDDDPKARAVLPSLLALRRALYSTQFRQFVTAVTGYVKRPTHHPSHGL